MNSVVLMAFAVVASGMPDKNYLTGQQDPSAVWEGCPSCRNPESVYFDKERGTLFVSNVAGEGNVKDGEGWISKLNVNGSTIEAKWVTGLNAPKGMRAQGNTLWVTDIDHVVVIDIDKGEITKRIPVPDAVFLNDIAIGKKGLVFVSDTLGNAIYKIWRDKVKVFAKGRKLEGPNGLAIKGNRLIVAAWGKKIADDWTTKKAGRLYSIDLKTKKKRLITREPLGNLDGLEIDGQGRFITSDWMAGKVFVVDKRGQSSTLYTGAQGVADLGYIPDTDTLILPAMKESRVMAFQLHPNSSQPLESLPAPTR